MGEPVMKADGEYASVQSWMSRVNDMFHLSEEEWTTRLGILREFCSAVDTDPDQMIAASRDSRDVKNDFMRQLKRFVRAHYPAPRAAHDAENVVRSFFIHNGARVFVRPYE
jgi:hypothetical protein